MALASCTRYYPGMVTTAASPKQEKPEKQYGSVLQPMLMLALLQQPKMEVLPKPTVDYGIKKWSFKTVYITRVTGPIHL